MTPVICPHGLPKFSCAPCRSAYMKEWRKKHPTYGKDRRRRIMAGPNGDAARAQAREWCRRYRDANRERCREYKRRWLAKRPDYSRNRYYARQERLTAEEARAERRAKYEAYKATGRRSTLPRRDADGRITSPTRRDIRRHVQRLGAACYLCGLPTIVGCKTDVACRTTLDHIVPVQDGGLGVPSNLAIAHHGCNSARRGNAQITPGNVPDDFRQRRIRRMAPRLARLQVVA